MEIWNLSSSVHIDIERVSAANEWGIECEHEKKMKEEQVEQAEVRKQEDKIVG